MYLRDCIKSIICGQRAWDAGSFRCVDVRFVNVKRLCILDIINVFTKLWPTKVVQNYVF